ncbi:MAG: cell division protein ZapB [Treponema sp.]|jgi:FtsZ-binding cell division protein ZapB|nr:cell division protein ZapB [Treponema sp.]
METLEHVKVLETKVADLIDFVKRVREENASYQKRINELEVLIQGFKEERGRIQEGILSALGRLNTFEDTMEKKPSALPLKSTGDEHSEDGIVPSEDASTGSPDSTSGQSEDNVEHHNF